MTSGKEITINKIAIALIHKLAHPAEDTVTVMSKQIYRAMLLGGLTISINTCREKIKVLEYAGLLQYERRAKANSGELIYGLDVKGLRTYLKSERPTSTEAATA